MSALRSPYLANVIELRRVVAGGGTLTGGATSPGIASVQAALRDRGYDLTRSTSQGNAMDMGESHRQGLAKEYGCHGSIRRRFSWTGELHAPRGDMIINSGGR